MIKKIIFISLIGIIAISAVFSFSPHQQIAEAQATLAPGLHSLQGYAWSKNVGWIHFSGTSTSDTRAFGVFLNVPTTGTTATLQGYAWANPRDSIVGNVNAGSNHNNGNNIGWLSFNNYSGCPSAPCQPQIDLSSGAVTGWARFYRPISSGGDSAGWDGWVHLSGPNYSVVSNNTSATNYGGVLDITQNKFKTNTFLWGGPDKVGWINMCGDTYCVSVDPGTNICQLGAPAAPTSFTARTSNQCGGQIDLSWTGIPPTGGFYIYRDGSSQPTFVRGPGDTSFTDGTVLPGSTHTYQIAAFNYCGGQYFTSPLVNSNPASVRASNSCNAAATFEFYARPDTVPKNGSCTLHWNIAYQANCTITQPTHVDTKVFAPIVSPVGGTSGATTTGSLTRSLLYTMTCNDGTTAVTKNATCYVAGDYQHF